MTKWQHITERDTYADPAAASESDPRDRPIDMVLTPRERDHAAYHTIYLEDRRRRLNERDARMPQPMVERGARAGSDV